MPSVLILKFGAIGDCVMALPAAHEMYRAGYCVNWVCGRAAEPVLRLYPWINVIPVDDRALLHGSIFSRSQAVVALWGVLAGKHYDVCATLYYDGRYRLLTLPVRATRKVMLSRLDRAKTLLPGRHHTDEYARIVSGRPDDVTPAQLAPLPPPSLPASPLPPVSGKARIVLVPGGARNMLRDDALRRWPVESYAAVAATLLDAGHEVVLAGGPDDVWVRPAFSGLAVGDLIGTLALADTLALLDSAAVTLTHDTGPLHLAGLTSTAIVAIFGPTDPWGRLPQRANVVGLWGGEGFACRPCYDGRNYAPCSNNLCMQQVTPTMVVVETETLLTARSEGRQLLPRVVLPSHTPLAQIQVARA